MSVKEAVIVPASVPGFWIYVSAGAVTAAIPTVGGFTGKLGMPLVVSSILSKLLVKRLSLLAAGSVPSNI